MAPPTGLCRSSGIARSAAASSTGSARNLTGGSRGASGRNGTTWWRAITAQATKMEQQREENDRLRWKVTLVFALGITGVLGLLFWSLASSPTSQVLAMCGARPAGPAEEPAKRLLENLSIGAGLPVPKLYVIDTPVPNAFAAGMDPSRSVVAVTQGLLALLDHPRTGRGAGPRDFPHRQSRYALEYCGDGDCAIPAAAVPDVAEAAQCEAGGRAARELDSGAEPLPDSVHHRDAAGFRLCVPDRATAGRQ